jgi:hypothetical protein
LNTRRHAHPCLEERKTTERLIAVAAALLALALLAALSCGPGERSVPGGASAPLTTAAEVEPPVSSDASDPGEEDLAIAYGFLLDSPRPKEVVEEGLRIAELLRQRYGIDTGNRYQDRLAAARRAQREFVDRLDFSQEEIEEMAGSLGYSLDPDECADSCAQVHRLSILELKKKALTAFAEGREGPGRLGPDAAEAAGVDPQD